MNIGNYHRDELRHEHNNINYESESSHESVVGPNFIEVCGYLIQM